MFFKVVDSKRLIRIGLCVSGLDDLISKSRNAFNFSREENVRVVLEGDGTMIVDEMYLQSLEPQTVLMVMKDTQSWQPEQSCSSSLPVDGRNEHMELNELIEKLKNPKKRQKEKIHSVKISCGWMHYSYVDRKYIQVRASKHNDIAGNVTLTFSLEEMYAEVSSKLINEFSPNGKSSKGHLKNMITQLGNSKGVIIDGNNFTVGQFVRNCATQKPRLYLMTKILGAVIETDSSDGDDFDLPDIQLKRKRSTPVLPVVTVTQTAVVNSASSPLVSLHSAGPSLHDTGTPTVSFNMDPSLMLCTVCFIELKNTVLIPCGHSLCAQCAARLYGAGDVCPMCRKTIERIQNMFI